MSVIAEFQTPSTAFELGQILSVEHQSSIELETLVPLGEEMIPLFWVYNSATEPFIESVNGHQSVSNATPVDEFDDRLLVRLEWDAHRDILLTGLKASDAQMMSATGTATVWEFEVRFPTHRALSEFKSHCKDADISMDLIRVFNPAKPGGGRWYGLSEPQREALELAIEKGYYDIPRRCTTKELGEELGISDQAVTERLRRAIVSFINHTILHPESGPRRN